MQEKPMVSIVIPVYNVEEYLEETLQCIEKQTLADIEIICVDDGSTDGSLEILKKHKETDSRIVIMQQKNRGAGAARNFGFTKVKGKYVLFFDSDDKCSLELLEKTVQCAEENAADIVAYDFLRFYEDGSTANAKGIHNDWLKGELSVFNYKDCPNTVMSIINPTPWNKLYNAEFVRKNNLKFEEISSTNDITFAAVSAAVAERISFIPERLVYYRVGHTGTISSTKTQKLYNVITAIQSALRQVKELSYFEEIKNSAYRFAMDNYLFALEHYITDFSLPIAKEYYETVHEYFNSPEFNDLDESVFWIELIRRFKVVKKYDYATMLEFTKKKIVVSLTTYPARIDGITTVLETIYNQTKPADEVVLWLAPGQFPDGKEGLPVDLRQLIDAGKLTLRWCDDLKPHKKYYYAFQEYPDDLIITIDDDLLYDQNMIKNLFFSYVEYPKAVSAMRTHLILIDEEYNFLPYRYWIKEITFCINKPSMQLLATGGAGTLYPPHLLNYDLMKADVIMDICPFADDLWLKAVEVMSDVPVVLAQKNYGLHYLPGSQEEALCHMNVDQDFNDTQLEKVARWFEEKFEEKVLEKKIVEYPFGERIVGMNAVCEMFRLTLDKETQRSRELRRRLNMAFEQKDKWQTANKEKGKRIKKLEAEVKKLKKANKELKASFSYRMGKTISWPLRKIYRIFKGLF